MHNTYLWLAVAVMALVTAALRFLPFGVFNRGKTPKVIEKLSASLPYAIMGMLVVYCLKDTRFTSFEGFLPPLISCSVVAVLHIWKRNTLLSIIAGTLCNMLLLQFIF